MDSEDRDPEAHRRFLYCETLACHLIELPLGGLTAKMWTFSLFAVFTSFHSSYASDFESKNSRLPLATVVEFKKLMQELNELKATGIYPLTELSATSRDKESQRGPRVLDREDSPGNISSHPRSITPSYKLEYYMMRYGELHSRWRTLYGLT
ncbi:hypothetical protein LB503_004553 [Fusarium chuoi]|nr:hypothetical protein LB503_004553 [Fusarium chuoi]